ncbi:MAG: hypothetical protein ABJC09_16145 [Terriglobia bacterium]
MSFLVLLINYWTSNIPNPFFGLTVPGAKTFSTNTTPQNLVMAAPQFTGLNAQTYEGRSSKQALNIEPRKKFAEGVTGQTAYTHEGQMDRNSFLHPDDVLPQKVISSQDFPESHRFEHYLRTAVR